MGDVTKEHLDRVVAGQTVASRFADTVREHSDRVALRWKSDPEGWGEWTWADYADRARRVATGLAGLGVGRGQRIVLLMRNIPEFHVIDAAALLCGATPVSIYSSSSPEQVQYLASHCQATVALVEDEGFLERVLKVRGELPDLRHIVVLGGEPQADVVPYDQLLANDPVDLAEASKLAQPDDLATIIYTSGTTGPPKGVMITHYNVCWTAECLRLGFGLEFEELVGKRLVSYLPMAHIAERMTSHYNAILSALEVTTCPEASQIGAYLRDVRPHIAFGVPRIWEKINAGVNAALAANPENKQKFEEAVTAAIPLVNKKTLEGSLPGDEEKTLAFLDEVAFKPVRELLGLDQMMFAITGAAPIPVELVEWFRALGVPLSEIYGMSENTGPLTWDAYRVKPGYVGRALPGITVRLADDGEVIAKGGNIFIGYLNDPEKTAEALDEDGWLRTGDIGEFDDEGYLRIVDRKKELIITAGGKNISPANIEAALKSFPLIGQACAIGDKRPFVSALLVLDPDVAPGWAAQHGIQGTALGQLAENGEVRAEVERNVAEANKRFSQVEQVKKFTILGEEWLPDSEELTPTMKLKRRGIHQKYAAEIEALYSK